MSHNENVPPEDVILKMKVLQDKKLEKRKQGILIDERYAIK